MNSFSKALLHEVLISRKNNYHDNFDPMMKYDARYHETNYSLREKLLNLVIPVGSELTIPRNFNQIVNPSKFYRNLISNFNDVSLLYNLLCDEASKKLLIKLLAYKILGYQKVKLPRNTSKYWGDIESIKNLDLGYGNLNINFVNLNLLLLDLSSIGFNIKANVTPAGASAIFAQKQYEYHNQEITIKAKNGEIALDCGACWGESSLYFAHEVGEKGKVYSFEFIPENLEIFNTNLNHNPHLKDRVVILDRPVWDTSDAELFYADHGPGSSVSKETGSQSHTQVCKTLSIDDLVTRQKIDKIHFIKMDIEGAEMNALKGAEKTLKRDKPKLAISLYHKEDDYITIPNYLNDLNLGYQFYLDHHSIHFWETILYAI